MICDWEPLDALARLLILSPEEREIWVDNRIVGVPISRLAVREGITKQGVAYRLKLIDAKLEARESTAVAA